VDEDNDGCFPDQSPVEVRYPRSKQEERGDRSRWPWPPGRFYSSFFPCCFRDNREVGPRTIAAPQSIALATAAASSSKATSMCILICSWPERRARSEAFSPVSWRRR